MYALLGVLVNILHTEGHVNNTMHHTRMFGVKMCNDSWLREAAMELNKRVTNGFDSHYLY